MSVCRKLPDGTIQKIAGHTILLDANASEVRTGTFDFIPREGSNFCDGIATFTDPMPDTDYAVVVDWKTASGISQYGRVQAKTTTGFKFEGYYGSDTDRAVYGTQQVNYIAWKPVKIEGYTELQNKVSNPDDTPTIDSMNLVTSDGVARAIENASAVWKGTRAEWDALPATDKVKYDLAVLLDQTLVKAIDRTDGTETNVADLSGQFVGTHAEWEAESNKTQYKTAVLTDDRKTVNEVTSTGTLNEVADLTRIWRGTKEEWDKLSDEEKDKWDQAEIDHYPVIYPPDYSSGYSTEEHWTGRRWIDGKKIYSKVLTGLSFNGDSSGWINTGATVSGLVRVIECKGWQEESSQLGLIHYTCQNYNSSGALYIHGMVNGLNPTNSLYVEYTKTTD